MTKTLATLAALGLALSATTTYAQTPLQMSYPTDASMTCEQISAEMVRMDQLMGLSRNGIGELIQLQKLTVL